MTTRLNVPPLVYSLHDGDAGMAEMLGGKCANVGEMTRLGLPVPEGFVVATTACREYLTDGHSPVQFRGEVTAAIAQLEERTARRFGDVTAPLIVSVRSGRRRSMPGMMDTVLNVGLVDDVVPGLAPVSPR